MLPSSLLLPQEQALLPLAIQPALLPSPSLEGQELPASPSPLGDVAYHQYLQTCLYLLAPSLPADLFP